jgi:tetratricopeptide (TPR) repeat protein
LVGQLNDTNALVRQMVVQSLGSLAQAGQNNVADALKARLEDSSRNVRVEAARQLAATLDTNSLAGRDYLRLLEHGADQPLGQLQAGTFHFQHDNPSNAVAYFARAAEWDSFSGGIRHEYAVVLSQLGHASEAVKQLEDAVRLQPDEAEFHYALALALNEAGETARVIPELEAAVKCDPRHARAWYNLGLARSGNGDDNGALEALNHAETVESNDPRIPYARATILAKRGEIEKARTAVQRALTLQPTYPEAAQLLQTLEKN